MQQNTRILLVAGGALLAGGIATAAFMGKDSGLASLVQTTPTEYADVLAVEPVRATEPVQATVTAATPVTEPVERTRQEEVCQDVVVNERLPERDGNVGGTVAGALIGGLVGNQVGGGSGRKVATAAGAVAGGVIGNRVDRNHVGGKVVQRTQRQCAPKSVSYTEDQVVGYDVSWRAPDGRTGTLRLPGQPGATVPVELEGKVIGYDVTYRYNGETAEARLPERPDGDRLPLREGRPLGLE